MKPFSAKIFDGFSESQLSDIVTFMRVNGAIRSPDLT
jgi:hypothetical protein